MHLCAPGVPAAWKARSTTFEGEVSQSSVLRRWRVAPRAVRKRPVGGPREESDSVSGGGAGGFVPGLRNGGKDVFELQAPFFYVRSTIN